MLRKIIKRAWKHYQRRHRYTSYIQSEAWRAKREEKFKQVGRRCERCGSTRSLECHHTSYKSFGNERLADLMILCHDCHKVADQERRQANRARYAR